MAGLVFSRLVRLTGETRWREAEELQFSYLAGAVQAYPAGHSVAMLAFLEALWPAGELVCTGREVPAELMDLLRREQRPGLCVLVKTPENQEALSALAPFTAEYPIPQQGARYYLCKNGTCTRPVDSIFELNWQENRTGVPGGF